jgi:hypothetical protein
VVGFTIGSRGKVPGKTCEKRRINNNNNNNNNAGSRRQGDETSSSIKIREFVEQLSDYKLLRASAPWS